jgi:hypothetical protein
VGAPFFKNGPVTLRRLDFDGFNVYARRGESLVLGALLPSQTGQPGKIKRPTAVRAFKLAAHPAETQVLAAEKHSQHSCPESPNG